MDLDVERSLRARAEITDFAAKQAVREHKLKWQIDSFVNMKSLPIYVWEPTAIEAFEKFWSVERNQKEFELLCVSGKDIRYISGLFEPAFHFFPTCGLPADITTLPEDAREPALIEAFRPRVHSITVGRIESGSTTYLPANLDSAFLDPLKLPQFRDEFVRQAAIRRAGEELVNLPFRDYIHHPLISDWTELRFPRVVGGFVHDPRPLHWFVFLYKLKIFLEQPFLGYKRTHVKKQHLRHMPGRPGEEVTTVLMREPLPTRVPRIEFPQVSRMTGRPLEFEVDVRAHIRHCASGVVTRVRAHKRGPRGVTRERVTKVIR